MNEKEEVSKLRKITDIILNRASFFLVRFWDVWKPE